ncbi:MAG: haloacid dehalogenase-like hydrolase [Paludibacteraceae bacterium]|nr:haloacid dehalogenase-like hydrolase [Paludibacteraceae bacterium]
MKTLYVLDFDKTLIPYDSFNRYLRHLVWLRPISVGCILSLRVLRIISVKSLKHWTSVIVWRSKFLQRDARHFANRLVYDIVWPEKVPHERGEVLLLSASPAVYMRYVAEALQTRLLCSDYIDGQFVHMYGENKAVYLQKKYPREKYHYAYAVSDSITDMCWLKEFEHFDLVELS